MDFKPFQTLTFDCYGTLIDWESGILGALQPILRAHGIERTDDELLELYAAEETAVEEGPFRNYREVLEEVARRLGRRLGFEPTAEQVESLPESVADWRPFPDTREALKKLERRFELVIVSNIDDDLFAGTLPHLGVELARVITAQQVGAYKPSKRVFRFALEQLESRREQILHVAQSLYHDIAPARELGFATCWIDRRHGQQGGGATPPATAEPDLTVPDLATLAKLSTGR